MEARGLDGPAHLASHRGHERNLMGAMPVGVFVLDVDDPNHLPLGHDGHGEKRLVAVFGQVMEELEARIIAGVAGDGHRAALLGHPAGDSFSQAQPDVPNQLGVGVLGGSEHELVSARVQRSEEHTSELQSLAYLVCRLLLEKKKKTEAMPLALLSMR